MKRTHLPIILFDVMETLVAEPFFRVACAHFGMDRDELLSVKHPTSWIEFEEGRISEVEYFSRFFRDGRPVDGAAVRERLRQAYRWVEGMPSLIAQLSTAGYEMHALSNYSIWYRMIEESLGLSRYLRWSFVSCQTGVRKPDPRAFRTPTQQLGVPPSACLFVDDREVNVVAAMAEGMDAILFTNAENLRTELHDRDLLA
jgi:HAD superfamily hydrolase (TIGR01493 family)